MIRRRQPLRKSGQRVKPITSERAKERRQYAKQKSAYLAAHPFCEIFIARHRLDADVVQRSGFQWAPGVFLATVPRATEIHHRLKSNGKRLLDERWWMACSRGEHEWVENNKGKARELGLLLPIQADSEGRWGSGNQALQTPEFMRSRSEQP